MEENSPEEVFQLHTYFLPLWSKQKVPVRVGRSRLQGNKTSVVMFKGSSSKEASELLNKSCPQNLLSFGIIVVESSRYYSYVDVSPGHIY